jgi:putative oxidoreductase
MSMHPSVAERITFGRPAETDEVAPIRVAPRPASALVARILIAAIFIMSGIAKLTDTAGTVDHMVKAGIPAAGTLVYVAAFAELLGGIAVLFGFLTRLAGVGLIIMMIITTAAFHNFWALTGDEQKAQMINFMKNLAIIGGLFMLVANGAGRFSIDAKIRRPIEP